VTAAAVATEAHRRPREGDPAEARALVGELYEAHSRLIAGLCRFLLRDAVEAQDAAQQTFLSAHRSVLGGRTPREPAAWLAAIARNECRARIKARMREPLPILDGAADSVADPSDAIAQRADLDALRSGLRRLSRPQREAFVLRGFAGLSYDELARALGLSGAAVESLLVRACVRLREGLASVNLLVPVVLRDQLVRLLRASATARSGLRRSSPPAEPGWCSRSGAA
jgi:RNA polymerase sigma-70 factor (ECF subfamily)